MNTQPLMGGEMTTKDRGQIGVPLGNIKKLFRDIAQRKYGEDMTTVLRALAREFVAAHSELSKEEMLRLGLVNEVIGGPAHMKNTCETWLKRKSALLAEIVREEETPPEPQPEPKEAPGGKQPPRKKKL